VKTYKCTRQYVNTLYYAFTSNDATKCTQSKIQMFNAHKNMKHELQLRIPLLKTCQIINATCKMCILWWNQQKLTFFWSMTIFATIYLGPSSLEMMSFRWWLKFLMGQPLVYFIQWCVDKVEQKNKPIIKSISGHMPI
jgi:hypothetical protein